jgi:hypothetical protein
MSSDERIILEKAITNKNFTLSPHAQERLEQKGVSRQAVFSAISRGQIIEGNNLDPRDLRVLLRDNLEDGSAVCVLLSMRDTCVVTAYPNSSEQSHFCDVRPEKFYRWRENLTTVLAKVVRTKGLR